MRYGLQCKKHITNDMNLLSALRALFPAQVRASVPPVALARRRRSVTPGVQVGRGTAPFERRWIGGRDGERASMDSQEVFRHPPTFYHQNLKI